MAKLNAKQKQKIIKLRNLFPKKINASIHSAEEGGFWATINDFHGCHTQGETFYELIGMINDCLYTYFEIPSEYVPYMPVYLPTLTAAAKFDFPRYLGKSGIDANIAIIRNTDEKVAV